MSGGGGPQWDVPQAIGAVPQAGDYYLVVFQYFYIKFGENGYVVLIAELLHGYEGACCDVIENVGGLCFGRKFVQKLQGGAKGWFDNVSVGNLNCWDGRGVCNLGEVWQGTGM